MDSMQAPAERTPTVDYLDGNDIDDLGLLVCPALLKDKKLVQGSIVGIQE